MSGSVPFKPYVPDRNLMFCEGQTQTSTGNAQYASADTILKVGRGRMDATLILAIAACKVSATDEAYDIYLQGSDSATFASGIVNLVHIRVGAVAALLAGATVNPATPLPARLEVPFTNAMPGAAMYDYLRLALVIAGTSPTITYDAWLSPDAD